MRKLRQRTKNKRYKASPYVAPKFCMPASKKKKNYSNLKTIEQYLKTDPKILKKELKKEQEEEIKARRKLVRKKFKALRAIENQLKKTTSFSASLIDKFIDELLEVIDDEIDNAVQNKPSVAKDNSLTCRSDSDYDRGYYPGPYYPYYPYYR